ncbi:NF-X1 type zinc finger protein [Rutstroemia sp. NJR-2017a WRK4]|nr:NF-X1 type zinc finger protein [Rutstroemia sp. NJR-2017a WRK4]
MATVESVPAPSSAPNRPPRSRRPRRGGHRNGGPAAAQANTTPNAANVPVNSLALRPASLEPLPNANASSSPNPNPSNNNRGGRGRRGGFGRGGRRGGPAGGAPRGQPMANGRAFGGQLTSNTVAGSETGSLAGDAPAFVPGHPIASRGAPSRAPRPRRMSKSQAPDLATRTHEDITNGQYECVICTNEVLPNSKIWNLVGITSVLREEVVKERGLDAPTARRRKWRTATTKAMEMSRL